jgi:hypothetical protein
VQEEAAQELFDRQGDEPLLVAVSGVAPAKGDVVVGKSNQPAVGNGNAMSVGTKIAQHVFWPEDDKALVQRMRAVHVLCDDTGDIATASLLENWIDQAQRRI